MIKRKRIALVGYQADYFQSFSAALDEAGIDVYWVCAIKSDALMLRAKFDIIESRVLDLGLTSKKLCSSYDTEFLSWLEGEGTPRVHDILLMDRILIKKETESSLRYISTVGKKLKAFLKSNDIDLVSSGRDTAMQLTAMLVARKLNIPWVVPTRFRIPLECYGFCSTHETDSYISLQPVSSSDLKWAKEILNEFKDNRQRPALKIAARNFRDTLMLLGPHSKQFSRLLGRSVTDRGNSFSRYTIPQLVKMYATRRWNMLLFSLYKPWVVPPDENFCIYALHTQPESSIDVAGSYFSDQVALIRLIVRSLPADHWLYVKIHPTDIDGKGLGFYRSISAIPGVRLIHDHRESRTLVNQASIVFTLTGTIGYEAALLGKAVITFAKNHYNILPSVRYCQNHAELSKLIESTMANRDLKSSEEQITNALAQIRPCLFDGEVNRMFGENPTALKTADIETLKKAYILLLEKFNV